MKYSIAGIVIFIVLLVAWKIAGKTPSSDSRRPNATLVQIEPPLCETVVYKLRFNGDVTPVQQATIFSKVSGTLEHEYVDMGDRVDENQTLALIDTTELSQQVQQTSATYLNARLNFERTKELAEQNLVSRQDLDNAEAGMKVAKANYDAAGTRLSYAHITAPFSGYITKRYLDAGASVTANNATLFVLMDLSAMKIVVNVLEKDVPSVKIGKKAIVTVDAYPEKEFPGTVTRFSNAIDLATRTMAIEVDIPNREYLLKPGMFATVIMLVEEHRNVITVQTQAVLQDDKGYYLYITENNTAKRQDVTIGIEQNNRTEILSGLEASDNVITMGQQFVKDGGPVTIIK